MTAATHVLTVRSKSGRPLDLLTREPVTSCAVYGLIDLGNRLAEVARRPDLEVSVHALEEGSP